MIIAATAIMSASAAADPLTPRNMNDDEWRLAMPARAGAASARRAASVAAKMAVWRMAPSLQPRAKP
jgi:hypothetical protein